MQVRRVRNKDATGVKMACWTDIVMGKLVVAVDNMSGVTRARKGAQHG